MSNTWQAARKNDWTIGTLLSSSMEFESFYIFNHLTAAIYWLVFAILVLALTILLHLLQRDSNGPKKGTKRIAVENEALRHHERLP